MTYDYIILGAGTSGCVLANRLSADPSVTVLLVEAGKRERGLWVSMPAGTSRLIHPGPANWGFHTEPEPGLGQRRIYAPRGRGLGGSSLINGMGYFRGQPADYESWAARGAPSWRWADLLPLFQRLERRPGGDPAWRGADGALAVTDARFQHPSSLDFVAAAEQAGYPRTADFNGAQPEGAGMIQFSIHNGQRHSSAEAFLYPAEGRRNLTVMTDTLVDRVVMDEGRAVAVDLLAGAARERQRIRAERDIIVSAGAFGSPAILQRSGIGPAEWLRQTGIDVVRDLPGVGRNLQDHLYIHYTFAATPETSMNAELRGWKALRHGLHYLLARQGPLTMGASQACAFVRSAPDQERADLQITYRPMSWRFEPDGSFEIGREPEITVSCCHLRPTSRGQVRVRSTDPAAAPAIQANYFTTGHDQQVGVASVGVVRKIFAMSPMRSRIAGEILPGPGVESEADVLAYIRDTAQSMHHWAGTCAMGSGADAVVDDQLRVHGVQGLRVADASVMPTIISANTNAPCFVIAERLAQLMQRAP
ncbi:MAG: GMC family oxidoreductase [Pigmentiphaga sp.]